jgi:predicted methyltransferase
MSHKTYTLITTEDGTSSLFNNDLQEAMHSRSGAYEEALLKHVRPSRALEVKRNHIRVLDVGFGLGYNILALLHERSKLLNVPFVEIITLEMDRTIFPLLRPVSFNDDRDPLYRTMCSVAGTGTVSAPGFSITLLTGDARATITSLGDASIDAVFQDPYSPSKNPELWTVEFFRELRRVVRDDAILTTYSSAPQVRMAMIGAGFAVGAGPSVGGKREGTLASLSGPIPVLGDEETAALRENVRATPYRDPLLSDERDVIVHRRRDEMKEQRAAKKDRRVPR